MPSCRWQLRPPARQCRRGKGDCDAQARCTFTAHWDDPISKQPVTARISIRWTNPSVEIFEMFGPGSDGKDMKIMEMTYTRK